MSTIKRQTSVRRQHARVTASDVARLAGVSPMTVSRVINGEDSVRQSTRSAVNRAIKQLGYLPNKAARSLASANQVQIGLLYTNPSSPYLSAMLFGVLEEARQSDTQIVVVECDEGPDALNAVHTMVLAGVDGILLTPPLADDLRVLEALQQEGVRVVTMGTRHPDLPFPSVCIDEYAAAQEVTHHLIALGHRRIGFIKGHPDHRSSSWRLDGFLDALQEAGLPLSPELLVDGRYSYRSGLEAADQLLNLPHPPTAIFASNDDMAAATVATAHRHNIEVPRDLTVVGFDDTLLATAIWPEMTTIHQPIADMAHAGIKLLVKTVRGTRNDAQLETEHLQLDYRLVKRQSDAPPLERND
jgi:LacI family transcriptional regulator